MSCILECVGGNNRGARDGRGRDQKRDVTGRVGRLSQRVGAAIGLHHLDRSLHAHTVWLAHMSLE